MKYLLKPFLILLLFSNSLFAQDRLIYNSAFLSKPDTVLVFKPQTYNSQTQQWPVIYLLNGYGGNYKQWNSIMDAQRYANEYGFIIVCPDGFNSWYINSPEQKNSQYQRFFFEELYPDILKKYRADQSKIFISGLSMGGHGALTLFLEHPNLFLSAGSTSGAMDLRNLTTKYGIAALLGNPEPQSDIWYQYSVLSKIDALAGSFKQIIFDCGTEDPFYESNNALRRKCDSLKINATYISQPGKHDRNYWAKSIRQQFNFFSSLLR